MHQQDEAPTSKQSVLIYPPELGGDLAAFLALLAEIGVERLRREAAQQSTEHPVQYDRSDHNEDMAA